LDLLFLGEQRTRAIEYLRGVDLQFSSVVDSIIRHRFPDTDSLCASMVLWACDACGGDAREALPIAASVECLHRFAVLHDGLQKAPALDLAQTLNAGDALHAVALQLLARDVRRPDRVLDIGTMFSQTLWLGIEQRSRLIAASGKSHRKARLRTAYGGTRSLLLGSSLLAGAMMAEAPSDVANALARAGRLLGTAAQLAAAAPGRSPLATRYAAKAVAGIERSSLDRTRVREFTEIAYHLAAAS
jgi:geranylgeranyl pyrophosphate synthase